MCVLTGSGNLDPGVTAFLAALHDLEPQRSGLFGRGAAEHEFIGKRVGQCVLSALGSPGDFLHAFGVFSAVRFIGLFQLADFGAHSPTGFHQGLRTVKTRRDGDRDGCGGRAGTTMAHPQYAPVAGPGCRSLVLQRYMRKSGGRAHGHCASSY